MAFIQEIQQRSEARNLEKADAVVVLTGAENRIKTGVALLKSNHGQRLLITGVGENTTRRAIARVTGEKNAFFGCCIDIDREAQNTIGNAEHTSNWVDQNGFERLIIVTSDYHMPRSLLLMKRQMPHIDLIPAPANVHYGPSDAGFSLKWLSPILLREFAKYMTARYGLEPPARMVMAALHPIYL
ncbi:MAG: YdcF family protein [Pseudomonadota bacterium]